MNPAVATSAVRPLRINRTTIVSIVLARFIYYCILFSSERSVKSEFQKSTELVLQSGVLSVIVTFKKKQGRFPSRKASFFFVCFLSIALWMRSNAEQRSCSVALPQPQPLSPEKPPGSAVGRFSHAEHAAIVSISCITRDLLS
jgi:hypothetical protein